MRSAVLGFTLVALTGSTASAIDPSGRTPHREKQVAPSKATWAAAPLRPRGAFPTTQETSDIPIIPLPTYLRPKRPPAGSSL